MTIPKEQFKEKIKNQYPREEEGRNPDYLLEEVPVELICDPDGSEDGGGEEGEWEHESEHVAAAGPSSGDHRESPLSPAE